MIINTQTLSAFETAVILHKHFGELRAWPDFLMDNIRGRQDVGGFTLMPCARRKGRTGFQPRYAVRDVVDFVNNLKAAVSLPSKPSAIKPITLAIDTRKLWRFNKFERNGKACRKVFAGAGTH